jgi:hypothetical protein
LQVPKPRGEEGCQWGQKGKTHLAKGLEGWEESRELWEFVYILGETDCAEECLNWKINFLIFINF